MKMELFLFLTFNFWLLTFDFEKGISTIQPCSYCLSKFEYQGAIQLLHYCALTEVGIIKKFIDLLEPALIRPHPPLWGGPGKGLYIS
jgi:hypothetical protein